MMRTSRPIVEVGMTRVLAVLVTVCISTVPAWAQTGGVTNGGQPPPDQSVQPPPDQPENQADQSGKPQTDQPEKKKNAAPEHAHTGWATLFKDSAHDFVAFPKRPST